MMIRYQIGSLDLISGILFLVGLNQLKNNPDLGIIIMGLAVLKQFSGR
jgi:hypothetical protein